MRFSVCPLESYACSFKWLAATFSSNALITSLSSSAEQWTGYAAQELVGRPLTHILADPSTFELPRMLEAAKDWGYWEGEIIHRARDGKLFESRGIISPLENRELDGGEYLLFSNFERALISGERKNSVVANIAADLRSLAHDLNNPLAVTMGFTQLLLLDQNCQGKVRADIEKLDSELKRVTQVVDKLHRYALSLHEKYQADPAIENVNAQASA
jgi:PAS domain S-box-containing protein